MAGKAGAALRVRAVCRGEGVGYVALAGDASCTGLSATAHLMRGASLPCELLSVEDAASRSLMAPGAEAVWIAVVPLVADDVEITVSREGVTLARVLFPALGSKLSSRLLTLAKPQVAQAIRGYEQCRRGGKCTVRLLEVWPADAGMVAWRVQVLFPTDNAVATPSLRVFDQQAHTIDARVVLMEDHVVPDARDASRFVRVVTFSCVMSEAVGSFYVVSTLGFEQRCRGFAGMNAPRAVGMLAQVRQRTGGAAADPSYGAWFEERRATTEELAWQRDACAAMDVAHKPLISIVMPVFRTPDTYLEAAISSIRAQTYDRWELLVVNASGSFAPVDAVLATVDDPRVRVIAVENRSIAENTNAGISACTGDYVAFVDHDDVLEPDALWHYVQAIAEQPDADLLYCDEDHLVGDEVHAPAFKPQPNYGKLYVHNYVTHLLMVSRFVLDRTERSGAEVAGAQDYDLTLKAFEVARAVVHVPRVLYHWREHAGSTSGGGDQKPFAHEAGRRALEAHLGRRGIAARVEDGALPYTYRVRYELCEPAPLVSVVIPTRDQAPLLDACVSSILSKTTYPRFEVVLVENNSVEQRTFLLYDELMRRDARVRVVTWQPPEPGVFNYSALVNFGVRASQGELVVLLNNDTRVIEPAWLEELAGCLMRPEVGVVGAKLLFEDGLIQHVGMVANPSGDLCHVCQNLTRDALGPGLAAAMPGDYSMVTGACQMMRRSLFDELGGYDERLAVGFNDGDFCLRAGEAGYAVTVAAGALLYHREFSTRGRELLDARLRARYLQEKAHMMAAHATFFAQRDPALNPNLDGYSAYFGL